MFCPRCGAENDAGNRFCVSCGSTFSRKPAGEPTAPLSKGERLKRVFGTTRRARLLSAATAAAILVAFVAFLALKPAEESRTEDAFLRGLDRSCVAEKERISTLEQETLRQQPPDLAEFAAVLVAIVAEWRTGLGATPAPPLHAPAVNALNIALREVLIDAGGLARVVREGRPAVALATQAGSIDKATANANRAIEGLGLDDCAELDVAPASAGQ